MAGFGGGGTAAPGSNASNASAVVNANSGIIDDPKARRRKQLQEKLARGEQLTPAEAAELGGNVGTPGNPFGGNVQSGAPGTSSVYHGPLDPANPNHQQFISGDPNHPLYGTVQDNKARDQLTTTRDNFFRERNAVGAPNVPQAFGQSGNTAWNEEARGVQLDNIERLRAIAEGRAPSVAEAQLKTSLLDSNQNVLGAIAARGAGAGSLRMGARQLSENARRSGLDAAIVRAGEIAAANTALANSGNSLRTNDQTLGQADADRILDADKANQAAALDANKQRIDERQGLGELGLDAQKTESSTRMNEAQIQNLKDQLKFAYAQLAQAKDQAERDFWGKVITSTIGALGGMLSIPVGGGKKD